MIQLDPNVMQIFTKKHTAKATRVLRNLFLENNLLIYIVSGLWSIRIIAKPEGW